MTAASTTSASHHPTQTGNSRQARPQPADMTAAAERREQFAAGLRELADFLLAHPDVPLPDGELGRCLHGSDDAMLAQLSQIAASLDAPVNVNDRGTHHNATRTFGPVSYRAFAVTAEYMRRWRALTSYDNNVQPDPAEAGAR